MIGLGCQLVDNLMFGEFIGERTAIGVQLYLFKLYLFRLIIEGPTNVTASVTVMHTA